MHSGDTVKCGRDASHCSAATRRDGSGSAADGADSATVEDAVYGGKEPDAVGQPLCDSAGCDGDATCDAGRCEYKRAGCRWNAAATERTAAGPECAGE